MARRKISSDIKGKRNVERAHMMYDAIESKGPVTNYDVPGRSQDFLRRVNRQKAIMMTVF